MTDKAVATVNTAMLDAAIASDSVWISSVMDNIHTLKIYNPRIGDPIEEDKAWKFKLKVANTWVEELLEGPMVFNPLSIAYFWSGSVYPILPDGSFASDKVFFTTNEFGKFTKKTDTIWVAAKWTALWFFTKEHFEKMIKCKTLNWAENQFYDRKKDKDWKPFDWSLLNKGSVIYGQFIWGKYDQEFFRFFTSPRNLWVTFRDWEVVEPDEWTFEYATNQWLSDLNELLLNNNRKAINKIDPTQTDIKLTIYQNDKKNFIPKFVYDWLVANRWEDNQESIKYIHDLKNEHFKSIFWTMLDPSPITIDGSSAKGTIVQPKLSAAKEDNWLAETAQATFADVHDWEIEDVEIEDKDLSTPNF